MDHDECVVVEDNPHDQRAGAEKQVKMRVERKMSVDEEGMTFFSYQMNTLVPDTRYRYSLTYSYDGRYAKLAPWASFMTVALTAPDRPPQEAFKLSSEACTIVRVSVPITSLDHYQDAVGKRKRSGIESRRLQCVRKGGCRRLGT